MAHEANFKDGYKSQGNSEVTGSLIVTNGITGSLQGSASYASTANIQYVTNSIQSLSQIEVADYDNNVAVTFTNGKLKFIFGTPTAPSAPTLTFNSTFATDRFNAISDNYDVSGSITINGYTLISASLYTGSVLLSQVGSGTTVRYNTTTTGTQYYRLDVTGSSPLDNSLNIQSVALTGSISKSDPTNPTVTPSATVQLGAASSQIEQGATGSISFTTAVGSANGWYFTSLVSSSLSPIYVTGSATGSATITIAATASYTSNTDNVPTLTKSVYGTSTYTKIRSLRYGASASSSFTSTELENLALWDTTLGGTIGTISKGTTTASGQTLTITWSGDKYHYIVFNSSLGNLTNITTNGFGVLGQFTLTTVGSYKVYKTNTLQAGGAGTSITYILT